MRIFFNKYLWKYTDPLIIEMKTRGSRLKGFLKAQLVFICITIIELLYVDCFSSHDIIGCPSLSFAFLLLIRNIYLRLKKNTLSKSSDK